MSRPLRIQYPGAYYHVMNRGRGRQKIYRSISDYQRFLDLLEETCKMWGLRVHAYCLMANHYHLLIETPQGNLSRIMRHLDGIYTQRYNRVHQSDGSLFRGRYKAILIDAESYLMQLVRYIHLNPVEAKLVEGPGEYRWSSHRYYLGRTKSIEGMVKDEVMKRFHTNQREAIDLYKGFMREGVDKQTQRLYERGNLLSVWGIESFRGRIRKQVRKMKLEDEMPQMKRERKATIKEIEQKVCSSYGVERNALKRKRRGYWNEPRNVAIYISRMVGGIRLGEIGKRWGELHYSSVSGMMYEVKRKMGEDKGLRRRVERIERFLLYQQK